MTVVYFVTCSFPDRGMATANRILHLARALKNDGVRVVVLTPFSDSGRREVVTCDGVVVRSLCALSKNGCVQRFRSLILFPLRALRCLFGFHDKVVLYSYTSSLPHMIWAYILSLLRWCPLCAEECEYPFSVLLHRNCFLQWLESRVVPLFYNGVVAISDNLEQYYKPRIRKTGRTIRIPMTVDADPFVESKGNRILDFEYIAYTGSMRREGGGVDVLVKAFALIANKHPQLHLVLIGDGTAETRRKFELLAGDARDRIHCIFGGKVSRVEMPRYISNAKILAMLPLPTKQQEGCFPTKLGEYLSSGVPVVITRVGNPIEYLTDNENVFCVPPNDVAATAAKFEEVLLNYSWAQQVGLAGREFACKNFHYAIFSRPLADWYREIAETNI